MSKAKEEYYLKIALSSNYMPFRKEVFNYVTELESEKAELIELVCRKCSINNICELKGLSRTKMLKYKGAK
jgi:hypothetical protein